MKLFLSIAIFASGCVFSLCAADGLSGGETTVFESGRSAFSRPLANITRDNRRSFVIGNSFFKRNWVAAPASAAARDGLGPFFHAHSCSGCHTLDGRGSPQGQGLLLRLSVGSKPHPTLGGQLGVRAIPGVEPEGEVEIVYEEISGEFVDGEPYSLRKPTYRFLSSSAYDRPDKALILGARVAPPVHGLGLLEAVPKADILALADPDDADDDGISGRANFVWNVGQQTKRLGRFGWKANQPSLRQQVASAFLNDIGITNPVFPDEALTESQIRALQQLPDGGRPEIEAQQFDHVVRYQQALAPPAQRNWDTLDFRRGAELFERANCTACHVPQLQTGRAANLDELANQTVRPFTDLLLHDMGEGLADGRPDFEATGSEWRTPPLWGIGLTKVVNGHTFFLHDGRARNLTEAILWHGGEAKKSRDVFVEMNTDERAALLFFLESI